MEERVVDEFNQKMTYERVNGNSMYENEIKMGYREILLALASSYEEYRRHIAKVLSGLESNNLHSIAYSIQLFFEFYQKLIVNKRFKDYNIDIFENDADDNTIEKIKAIFEETFSNNNNLRLSANNFNLSTLSIEDKKKIAALIIHKLQEDSKNLNWDNKLVEENLQQLIFLRQILISLNNIEQLYHVIRIFFERLTTSGYFQPSRDLVEDVIIASYKDNVPELGYLNSFVFYADTGSIHAALLYANLSMDIILQKASFYSEKYIKEIIWHALKLFRNVHLQDFVREMYINIPNELKFLNFEKRAIDHTYFNSLLYDEDESLPSILLDYFGRERENIFRGGIHEIMPWLLTLYNMKRRYPNADFSQNGLGSYLNIFESIIPVELIRKQKDIIEANSPAIIAHLKESLIKLNETRNKTDFVYDNETAIIISNRVIEYSISNKDTSAFLLAMTLKSDYSILFKSKEVPEFGPLILPDINIELLQTIYETKQFFRELPIGSNGLVIWLAFVEGQIYQLSLMDGIYSLSKRNNWIYKAFKDLIDADYFADMSFSETVKDSSGVSFAFPEEFKEEGKKIAEKLDFGKLVIPSGAKSIYIIKDMEISKFPHNLFTDENGHFLSDKYPITNVLSTEWFLQKKVIEPLKNDYSKSIWIPTESGDFALNILFSNIEGVLNANNFDIHKQAVLSEPLSSDINIICSHGAKNISEVQVVFQENSPISDLSNIIGRGRILIFFVCYSGSMKTEFFRNNVTSMVKRFIAKGYDVVIAPFWALEVSIPKYWLPEFLDSLNKGLTVDVAMFNANRKIYDVYPTPAASACLHIYGCPHLRVI